MRTRSFAVVAILLAVLAVIAAGTLLYDRGHRETIAKGVSVAGIDVGGMKPRQARQRLRAEFLAPLRKPVVVHYQDQTFTLTPKQAHVSADIRAMVSEALERSRRGSIFTRVYRDVSGGSLNVDLDPRIHYSHKAVDALVDHVGETVNREPKDASVTFSASSLGTVEGQEGIALKARRLRRAIKHALVDGEGDRKVAVRVDTIQPEVTVDELADRYPTVITVDRANHELYLFKGLELATTYPIAVGMAGLETPAGLYDVQNKQVNPSWHVPNSPWAGDLAGQVIPPGPQDPLKARWMGIYNGAGIHGTDEVGSIGTSGSHGCIRMRIPDVIALYDQVPLHTPVYIA